MNCPTSRCSDAGRDPADRTGIQCAPTPRPGSQDPVPPVRRPAARAAQGPPAQGEPDRDRARRSLTRIRPGQGLLLAVQPPTGRGPRLLPANRPQCPGSPPGGRLGPGRARGQQSDRPGYLADLASGAGNPPHSLKPVGPTPQNGWGAPPQTGWTRIQNRGRRRERRIPKIRVRTITTGDPSDPDTGPRVLRRPDPTPGTPGCARLPARQSARCSPISQPGAAEPLAPAPPVIDLPPARAIGCRPGPSRGTSATPVSTTAKGSGLGHERPTPRSGRPRPGPSPRPPRAPGRPRSP